MSYLKRRKKKKKPSPTLQSLPDDLLLNCFARISRLYYPTLSLVSKSFRSLLASSELYKTRYLLNRTESCLYVCLRFTGDHNPRWFTLCRKPNQTLITKKKNKKKSSEYVLVPIPSHNSPPPPHACWSGLVAVGFNIYNIGGSIDKSLPSSSLSILDCRSHTWHEGPNMSVESKRSSASVVDGNIYVTHDRNFDSNYDPFIEVFDTKTQTWNDVLIPKWEFEWNWTHTVKTACVDGKFHMLVGRQGLAYSPKEVRWDIVEPEMGNYWPSWSGFCGIENTLYWCHSGVFFWYDTKERSSKNLKVLGLTIPPNYSYFKLADYGGKLAVLWDEYSPYPSNKTKKITIRCAVITLEKQENREILGKVEWEDSVFTTFDSHQLVKVLATTL